MDCNIKLYGGGSWSSYPDLFQKVKASYRDPMPTAGIAPGANGATIAGLSGQFFAARSSATPMVSSQSGGVVAPRT